jgi:hypothetical protein
MDNAQDQPQPYERPQVTDIGSLRDLTAGPGKSFSYPDNSLGVPIGS